MTKTISILKTKSDKKHPYYIANKKASVAAMKSLTKSAFYLYTYFMQNDDCIVLTLRRTHVMDITGLSKSSYYLALQELIDKKYVVKCADGYEFHECPRGDGD